MGVPSEIPPAEERARVERRVAPDHVLLRDERGQAHVAAPAPGVVHAQGRVLMLHQFVGTTCVILHGEQPPADAEWQRFLGEFIPRTTDGTVAGVLVFSDGSGPSLMQRARLVRGAKAYFSRAIPTAVVTHSKIARGIATAVGWFNPALASFAPDHLREACDHLQVPTAHREDIVRCLAVMRVKLSGAAPGAVVAAETAASCEAIAVLMDQIARERLAGVRNRLAR